MPKGLMWMWQNERLTSCQSLSILCMSQKRDCAGTWQICLPCRVHSRLWRTQLCPPEISFICVSNSANALAAMPVSRLQYWAQHLHGWGMRISAWNVRELWQQSSAGKHSFETACFLKLLSHLWLARLHHCVCNFMYWGNAHSTTHVHCTVREYPTDNKSLP